MPFGYTGVMKSSTIRAYIPLILCLYYTQSYLSNCY